MVPNSTVITVAGTFKSRLLKIAKCCKKKNSHISVIKLKLQIRYFWLLLVHNRGSNWTPSKNCFPNGILPQNLHHIWRHLKQPLIREKIQNITVSKWWAKILISIGEKWSHDQNFETTSPPPKKKINEIGLEVGEHEQIYITETKFRKKTKRSAKMICHITQ